MDFQIYASPVQQGRLKYTAVLDMSTAAQLIQLLDWNELPIESAPQRPQNRKHASNIHHYIMEHPDSYNLPPLTLVVDKAMYKALGNHPFGRLTIASTSRIYPIDGQHRLMAIRLMNAIKESSTFRRNQITVEIFVNLTISERQELFVTMNTAKKVPKQILISIGQSEEFRIARRVANETNFYSLIEKEKASVSKGSLQVFTLSQLFDAFNGPCKGMLFDEDAALIDETEHLIVKSADLISNSISAYSLLRDGDVYVKESCLACDPYFFQAIFQAVFQAMKIWQVPPSKISNVLKQLDFRRYDGNKLNPLWEDFLTPLPYAKVVKLKKNKDEITRIVISKLTEDL
jgi:DGQHR domain-containing protein